MSATREKIVTLAKKVAFVKQTTRKLNMIINTAIGNDLKKPKKLYSQMIYFLAIVRKNQIQIVYDCCDSDLILHFLQILFILIR